MRRNILMKRIAATSLAITLTVGMLTGVPTTSITAKAATDYGISGPTKDDNGNVVYDRITFGNYWQEDTNGDGVANKQDEKTPIKWRVLSVDGDDAFLVADQVLDFQRYNDIYEAVTWENCTIRSWLNGYNASNNICEQDYTANGASFISNAFTESEQESIKEITVENKANQFSGTEGGEDTIDKIFLLSLEDMTKSEYGFSNFDFEKGNDYDSAEEEWDGDDDYYFAYDYAKLRTVTDYAKNNKILDGWINSLDILWWWLRSPGEYGINHSATLVVGSSGCVDSLGENVNEFSLGVLPALHLDLTSSNTWEIVKSVTCTITGIGFDRTDYFVTDESETHLHSWNEGVITTPATETTTGIKTYTCDECGKTRTEIILKNYSENSQSKYGISGPMQDENGHVVYNCITFGNYWQEDTNGDGVANKQDEKIPIKWRVLSVDGDDAFLVADQVLDVQRYNDTDTSVTWENCTMRSWLNGYDESNNICEQDYTANGASFISNAFTDSEQTAINETTIENKNNQEYNTEGGNDTTDKIFLLSLDDITKSEYGFSNFDSMTKTRTVTAFSGGIGYPEGDGYVFKDNLDTASGYGHCSKDGTNMWWLRSPGEYSYRASFADNMVNTTGDYVCFGNFYCGTVPALHLNLSSSDVWKKIESVTCTAKGLGLNIDNSSTDESNKHIHSWDNGTVTTPATETATGVKTYKCSGCSETKTEVIPKLTPQKPSGNSTDNGNASGNNVNGGNDNTSTVTPPTVSKVSSFKATAKKKALSISWKKVTGASGYELQYSTKSSFKGAKTKNISKSKKSYTISKLKAKKKYHVRIRAYKNYKDVAGKTKKAVGNWVKLNKKTK